MSQIYDMVIVGGGPAGLTAAIYGQRAGLSLLLLEASYISGGQIQNTYEVDNYPGLSGISGMELADRFTEHAEKTGMEQRQGEVSSIKKENGLFALQTENEQITARTVVLASGAGFRKLGIPGEEKLTGMGVSYCATCDGAFFRGKTVAVVGGGNVAAEDAIYLARGCKKVYVVHRRDELRAAKILQNELLSLKNVEMKWSSVAEEVLGSIQVSGVRLRNVLTDETEELLVDGVFIAVGILPNTGFVKELVECDAAGYIIAGEDTRTSVPGIFAAGDLRTKQMRQVITAAADGAVAVSSVQEYLLENHRG